MTKKNLQIDEFHKKIDKPMEEKRSNKFEMDSRWSGSNHEVMVYRCN